MVVTMMIVAIASVLIGFRGRMITVAVTTSGLFLCRFFAGLMILNSVIHPVIAMSDVYPCCTVAQKDHAASEAHEDVTENRSHQDFGG